MAAISMRVAVVCKVGRVHLDRVQKERLAHKTGKHVQASLCFHIHTLVSGKTSLHTIHL